MLQAAIDIGVTKRADIHGLFDVSVQWMSSRAPRDRGQRPKVGQGDHEASCGLDAGPVGEVISCEQAAEDRPADQRPDPRREVGGQGRSGDQLHCDGADTDRLDCGCIVTANSLWAHRVVMA